MTELASLTHIRVVVDHTLPTQLQRSTRSTRVRDLALILLISVLVLAYHVFIFCQKSRLSNRFATLFTPSQPFNEMFIFSGKSPCCNGTFVIYIAASKEYLSRRQVILDAAESTFHQL